VVKRAFVDRRDIFSSPFMFGVAFPAFLQFLEAPVKAVFVIDVLADLFVAIEAESRLRRFVEPFVTGRAGLFPLGMALDHLARHEGRFNAVGPGRVCEKRS
jgi:hypothetical protein